MLWCFWKWSSKACELCKRCTSWASRWSWVLKVGMKGEQKVGRLNDSAVWWVWSFPWYLILTRFQQFQLHFSSNPPNQPSKVSTTAHISTTWKCQILSPSLIHSKITVTHKKLILKAKTPSTRILSITHELVIHSDYSNWSRKVFPTAIKWNSNHRSF
jgi:hypothetical protein